MDVRDFDFDLPAGLIAQEPAADRGSSRLLHLDRATGAVAHTRFAALPDLLAPGDLVVVNDTRVFPARLLGRRVPSGGAVECLLLRRCDDEHWEALVHPGQKLKPGAHLVFGAAGSPGLSAEILERQFHGRRLIRLWTDSAASVDDIIDQIGHVPLPPYIKRADRDADRERYQTIFAERRGSIAAPTAGLHFTESVRAALRARGVYLAAITLHVGYGTFQPVRTDRVEEHRIEAEWYDVDAAAAQAVNAALDEGVSSPSAPPPRGRSGRGRRQRRPVGRRRRADRPVHLSGFSFPGDQRSVDELPPAAVVAVDARRGIRRPRPMLAAYAEAVAQGYRFYSYGDAMVIL
jgi:S-adenosylmethionine:tRNA ribosyltransferase-isomerase